MVLIPGVIAHDWSHYAFMLVTVLLFSTAIFVGCSEWSKC